MGTSIDIHIYETQNIWDEKNKKMNDGLFCRLEQWGANNFELMFHILQHCGTFLEGKYILLNNELYDENNPYYLAADLLDSAFEKEDSFNILLDWGNKYSKQGINAVDACGVAEELGFKLKEDEDEDEKDF